MAHLANAHAAAGPGRCARRGNGGSMRAPHLILPERAIDPHHDDEARNSRSKILSVLSTASSRVMLHLWTTGATRYPAAVVLGERAGLDAETPTRRRAGAITRRLLRRAAPQ